MEEQLISLKTALLAKEKGFNLKILTFFALKNPEYIYDTYKKGDIIMYFPTESFTGIEKYEDILSEYGFDDSDTILKCPTQALLQRWLREKHNIVIIPLPKEQYPDNILTNEYNILAYINNKQIDYIDGTYWGYEEALEEGLHQALKLINN